jgi:hypothetical protein
MKVIWKFLNVKNILKIQLIYKELIFWKEKLVG